MSKNKWSLSDERAFIENILNQRFNFFLIFFSIVIAGLIAVNDPLYFKILIGLGTLICWLIALTLYRSQSKLDIILDDFIHNDDSHPAAMVDAKSKGISKRKIIGYIIPTICCAVLTVGLIMTFCGCLPMNN